ncbi:hypothetical protein DEM26_01910 [Thioclava sp. NG1]|nr:hypothetical protein DEM26_01910 [Thioclava sp. NG1]
MRSHILITFHRRFRECQGDDTLRGNLGADYLFDAEGANALYGGYGDDELYASDLDGVPDLLDGGANNDYLNGDDGDTMTGAPGRIGSGSTGTRAMRR